MRGSLVPDAVLAFVARRVGQPRRASLEPLDRADRVFGLEVDGPAGTTAIVIKRFAAPRLFEQEQRALTVWLASRALLGGARVPTLLAADTSLRTLVCTRLSGASPDAITPGPTELASIHHAAGRALAALHQLPVVDADPLPLATALVQRHRAWSRLCADALGPREREVVRALAPTSALFAGAERVPCHRDFTPDNWLWDGHSLALVDFEHARSDLALVDLAKLVVDSWDHQPALEIAFFEGYGRRLSAAEVAQLRAVIMLHGIASLAWGLRHGDLGFVAQGRRALAMLDPSPP